MLDASERLIAEWGEAGLTLRAVAAAAGANLAAVHYHFGSRALLIAATYARRLRPVNDERLVLLGVAERAAQGTPDLEQALVAFIAPVLRHGEALDGLADAANGSGQDPAEASLPLRFLARALAFAEQQAHARTQARPRISSRRSRSGTGSGARRALDSHTLIAARFHAIAQRCLPALPAHDLAFRLHLAIGLLIHVTATLHRPVGTAQAGPDPYATELTICRLTRFLLAGLRAP